MKSIPSNRGCAGTLSEGQALPAEASALSMSETNPSHPPTTAASDISQAPQTVIYEARVEEIGAMVPELLEAGVLIFFGKQAPPELREIAIVHDGTTLMASLAPGDIIHLGEARYVITGVGEVASDNFATLGHIVIKANGAAEAELPGEVSVEVGALHLPDIGATLRILKQRETMANISAHAGTPLPSPPTATAPTSETPSTLHEPSQHQQRRSLWAFLNGWRSSKRRVARSG